MSYYDYADDDIVSAAMSCKLFFPRSTASAGKNWSDGISCSLCNSWNGSRCKKRVLDNTLSVPELE